MRLLTLLCLCFAIPVLRAQDPAAVNAAVESAIQKGEVPGAVVLVTKDGKTVFAKAYGNRSLEPAKEAMTLDTIFDMASITKPVACAGSIWKLIEAGKLKVTDKAVQHWPEFTGNGKEEITIQHLLTHTAGLIADNAIGDYAGGKEAGLKKICELKLKNPVGAKFEYSDVGFIVLGHLVERISGEKLEDFAAKNLFKPLGLADTGYLPPKDKWARVAPTGKRDGAIIRGEVHDPRSFKMGGVAGHAGLFGTAEELAKYANALLEGKLFKPETVKAMTDPVAVPGGFRSLGWDVSTGFTGQAGAVFDRKKGFGHTGFTGTSIWVDKETKSVIVILSNRVHPNDKGNASPVRRAIATIFGEALTGRKAPPVKMNTMAGIDVLKEAGFASLKGKTIGLVTNHTGRDREGNATIDILHKAEGVKLVALFSPEHGIRGEEDKENVGDTKDAKTGLPVYSLYAGKRRKPTPEMLKGIDILVYDVQDIGCRFYTYISTLGNVLEAAKENNVAVMVLDRPNPIGGVAVQGPMLDPGKEAFVAYHPIVVRHGMTVGELAKMMNEERGWKVPLDVVAVRSWSRADTFDQTGLGWVDPSPNMRSLTAALLYPGVGLLETTNISVGRGTERPFEWVGAPYIDGAKWAADLAEAKLPGVAFVPTKRTPTASKFAKEECGGVAIIVTDWNMVDPLRTGMVMASSLKKLFPSWSTKSFDTLLRNQATLEGVNAGKPVDDLMKAWEPGLKAFGERRAKYLLYP